MALLRQMGGRAYGTLRQMISRPIKDVTFELHWRYLGNPRGAREFQLRPPSLDAVQQRVVGELRRRGIALVHFTELFGPAEDALYQQVTRSILDFAHGPRVAEEARRYQQAPSQASWKEYVVKIFPHERGTPIDWNHPVFQTAINHRLLDVVGTYLGMWPRLIHANSWYTVPLADAGRARIASQRWHRDPEDRRLIKAFLFVDDVDESAGPFEYVPSTRTDGARPRLVPPVRGFTPSTKYNYPPQEVVDQEISRSERVVCTCPAGTFVLVDTSGFHRGGFATARPRIQGTWTYVTAASRYPRLYTVRGAPPLDAAVRKAILD
jgi:hypothetical protein